MKIMSILQRRVVKGVQVIKGAILANLQQIIKVTKGATPAMPQKVTMTTILAVVATIIDQEAIVKTAAGVDFHEIVI